MAKWKGKIGFIENVEKEPGYYDEVATEKPYRGDLIRHIGRWTNSSDSTNGDVSVNNQISIVANPYAKENFHSMRYIEFMGTMWNISSKEARYPRIIITLGGVYNGKQATTAE